MEYLTIHIELSLSIIWVLRR